MRLTQVVTRTGRASVKLFGDESAVFARIDLFADDVVGDLTKRAASELQWGVDAGHIELFLVRRDGEDEPTSEEEAAALNGPRLGATVSLERAGIMDGICLLAKVTALASKLGKNQRTSDKAGYANPRVGASLIDRSCCLFYSSCEQ